MRSASEGGDDGRVWRETASLRASVALRNRAVLPGVLAGTLRSDVSHDCALASWRTAVARLETDLIKSALTGERIPLASDPIANWCDGNLRAVSHDGAQS